jgi:hypothetical protein
MAGFVKSAIAVAPVGGSRISLTLNPGYAS